MTGSKTQCILMNPKLLPNDKKSSSPYAVRKGLQRQEGREEQDEEMQKEREGLAYFTKRSEELIPLRSLVLDLTGTYCSK